MLWRKIEPGSSRAFHKARNPLGVSEFIKPSTRQMDL